MNTVLATKMALRVAMWRNPARRDDIRKVLRDRDLLEAVTEEITYYVAAELGGIGDGSFIEFFQMLLENLPKILEFITQLLILFADED